MRYCKTTIKVFVFGRLFHVFSLTALALLMCNFWAMEEGLCAQEESLADMINPHWSSKHCNECHEEDQPSAESHVLRFKDDPVQLCNRCHKSEFARADLHPVGIKLSEKMNEQYSEKWPLLNGKISCLTCHDSLLQMEENAPVQETNKYFLRGAPYGSLIDFCFVCHFKDDYMNTDPHKQLDKDGKIIENQCLFCHQSLPDSDVVENIGGVSFKDELALNCINCHKELNHDHPGRADHLLALSEPMKELLQAESTRRNMELPLDNETIFCGTCHNPHEKGVIHRKAVAGGAGEKEFLRMKDYDLCLMCHPDERFEKVQPQPEEILEVINPHWTGEHCQECHLEAAPKGENPDLKFKGDSVELCNRCHMAGLAKVESHSVGIAPGEAMREKLPEGWPLKNDMVTCLTCHNVIPQMYDDMMRKMDNPYFIRGAPYSEMTDFCFSCHSGREYQQHSPHNQLNTQGEIIEDRCLFCHRTFPDQALTDTIENVTFKGDLSLYCLGCHARQKKLHPARADHKGQISDSMKKSLAVLLEERGVALPLNNDTIICATCHNPHEKGVVKREAAKYGAGDKYFMRLDKNYDLCVSCHADKSLEQLSGEQKIAGQGLPVTGTKQLSYHKAWKEKKCRMCHVATVENREKPKAMSICFQEGCHNREIVEKEFVHIKNIAGDCYLCHAPHATSNKKLLIQPQLELCRSCHPLLKGSEETGLMPLEIKAAEENAAEPPVKPEDLQQSAEKEKRFKKKTSKKSKVSHTVYSDFIQTIDIPRKQACGFCHSVTHREYAETISLKTCAQCHIFVQRTMSESALAAVNIHQEFVTKKCSRCHDPHSSPYEHMLQLDKELDWYKRKPYNPNKTENPLPETELPGLDIEY